MRVALVLLLLPVLGCGDGGAADTYTLITPMYGSYQATLTGYSGRTCAMSLTDTVGLLDASASFGYVEDGQIQLFGGHLWPFGAVLITPGDPGDMVARVSWVGTETMEGDVAGCRLRATVVMQYFPVAVDRGSLHVDLKYALASGSCTLTPLPCENQAIWSFYRPPPG